ncbi:hypothetical protein, partial [Bacillus sp. CDB3]|uniref:hypothetical protein n=1 Tax=Bacillus sp. CDB3 TaxID=360310 RepID=UPI0009D808D5
TGPKGDPGPAGTGTNCPCIVRYDVAIPNLGSIPDIPAGSDVPFPITKVNVPGSLITSNQNNTIYTVHEPGIYRIFFQVMQIVVIDARLPNTMDSAGTVAIFINGQQYANTEGARISPTLASGNQVISAEAIADLNSGSTIEIRNSDIWGHPLRGFTPNGLSFDDCGVRVIIIERICCK